MSSDTATKKDCTAAAASTAVADEHSSKDSAAATAVADDVSKDSATSKKITLKASDGEDFLVDEKVAMEFKTVKSFFDDSNDDSDRVVPLPNVPSASLAKIVMFCSKHVQFRDQKAKAEDVRAFDAEFVKEMDNEFIKEMILSANYLNIKDLLDLLTQTVADRIRNKSVEYVRAFFGVENDYTEEEEAALRRENAWAFEGVDDSV